MASTIFDNLPIPPAARLLGWKLLALNPQVGTIEVEFAATSECTNLSGFIQGGFLAAMLDDTLGPAGFAMTGCTWMPTTIDLHVHYVRPILPSRVTTKAKVINLGGTIAFVEGELVDAGGKLCATAAASAVLTNLRPSGR